MFDSQNLVDGFVRETVHVIKILNGILDGFFSNLLQRYSNKYVGRYNILYKQKKNDIRDRCRRTIESRETRSKYLQTDTDYWVEYYVIVN